MKRLIRVLCLACALSLFLTASWADETEIIGPHVRIEEAAIRVSTALSLSKKSLGELRNGISKELTFTIDLFRVWKMWPDEFVVGKTYVRTLRSNPVTTEYRATSNDGSVIIQKKFKSFESMIQWALSVNDLKLAQLSDLEEGTYFVRVTVESRIRKLPPVIGYFIIFLPENEFKIRKDSAPFSVGSRK